MLFFIAHNFSIFEEQVLKVLNGIKLPSASESILYIIQVLLWLVLDSNLINMIYCIPSRFMYFTITTSKLLSYPPCFTLFDSSSWLILRTYLLPLWSCCCQCADLNTTLKWFCFPHLLHFYCMQGTVLVWVLYHNTCNFLLCFFSSRCLIVMFLCAVPDSIKSFELFYVV